MLRTKAAGRAPSIVVGSPSLGTTPRNIDLARGSIVSSIAICRVSISVVVDDVAALVDFPHGLELGVDDDDVHGVQQCVAEMQFYAQFYCPFVPDGSRDHRTGRGSGRNRRRCSRVGSRCESVRSPRPATSCRSRRTRSIRRGKSVM